jgi:DNA-binding XRE family transcriptional regulator
MSARHEQLARLADLADRARAAGDGDAAARALDLARRLVASRPAEPSRPVDGVDVVDPLRPGDLPGRSRHAHRRLDPAVARMLVRERIARGWSQQEAARWVGMSRRYLGYLEAGERVPSTLMADALIRGYELDREDARLLRSVALSNVGYLRHADPV